MNKEEATKNLNRFLKPLYRKYGSKTNIITKFNREFLKNNPKVKTSLERAILDKSYTWKSFKRVIESGKPFISFIKSDYSKTVRIKSIIYFYNVEENSVDYIMIFHRVGESGSEYFLNLHKDDYYTMRRFDEKGDMWFKWPLFHDFEEYLFLEDLVGWENPFLNWASDKPWEGEK